MRPIRFMMILVLALALAGCGNRRPEGEALELQVGARATPPLPGPAPVGAASIPDGSEASLPSVPGGEVTVPGGAPAPAPRPAATGPGAAGDRRRQTGGPSPTGAEPSKGTGTAAAPDPSVARPGGPSAGPEAVAPAAAAAGPALYDQGASDTEIRFGSVSSLTGLVPDFMQPRGARAYFKYVNAIGGVKGRKLTLLIYDDQWDVTRNAALTRQALESDKVFAFVANYSPLANHGGRAFIEQHHVPVVGGDMINLKTWGVSPNYYPQSYLESVAGGQLAGRLAAELGCRKVAGMAVSADESRSWVKAFLRGLQDRGVPAFVYEADISLAETDYTPYAASAKSKGAECITLGGETASFIRLRKAMSQQGYDARLILPSSAYDPRYTQDVEVPDGDHIIVQYDILENQDSNPAVKEFVQQASRFEPGMRQNGYSLLAWTAAKIATAALRQMGDTITRERLFAVLDSLKGYDSGITPPISYSPGPHTGANCGNVVKVEGNRFQMVRRNYCL